MDRSTREVKGHDSKVVFFSNLPREDEKKKELLTIAERFGIVEKHLFLTDQVNPVQTDRRHITSPDTHVPVCVCVRAPGVCPAGHCGGCRDAGEVLQHEPPHH